MRLSEIRQRCSYLSRTRSKGRHPLGAPSCCPPDITVSGRSRAKGRWWQQHPERSPISRQLAQVTLESPPPSAKKVDLPPPLRTPRRTTTMRGRRMLLLPQRY